MLKNQRGIAPILLLVLSLVPVGLITFYYLSNNSSTSQNTPDTQNNTLQLSPTQASTPVPTTTTISPSPTTNLQPTQSIRYISLVDSDTLWYLKQGNIWKAQKLVDNTYSTELFIDHKNDIIDFDVSPNNNLIAYVVKEFDYQDFSTIYDYISDTVLVNNLETGETNQIYTVDPATENSIRTVKFSNSGEKLAITNNNILIVATSDYSIDTIFTTEKDSFCSNYFVEEFSPNDDLVISRLGCYEGSNSLVINLNDKKELYRTSLSYIGGSNILGFIDNESILGVEYNKQISPTQEVDVNFKYQFFIGRETPVDISPAGTVRLKSQNNDFVFASSDFKSIYKLNDNGVSAEPIIDSENGYLILVENYSNYSLFYGNIYETNTNNLTFIDGFTLGSHTELFNTVLFSNN